MKTPKDRFLLMFILLASVTTMLVLNSLHVGAQGPANGSAVHAVNTSSTVIASTTTPVTVSGKSVFFQSSLPSCDTPNRCSVAFPTVPVNKRLRITRIHGVVFNSSSNAFIALDMDQLGRPVFVIPFATFNASYLGNLLSFNEATDVVLEAGQRPILEMGTSGTFFPNTNNRLGITGDLLDLQ